MRPDRFEGKVCIVTGGASGIGAAAARGFAAEGARVVLLDLDEKALTQTAATIPGARTFVVDVSSKASIDKAFRQMKEVHVLVNSASVIGKVTLQNMTEEEWDRVFDVNLKGTALCTQAVIAPIRAQRAQSPYWGR